MAIAALDAYRHRLIVSRAYTQREMPAKLADVTVGTSAGTRAASRNPELLASGAGREPAEDDDPRARRDL